MASLGMYDTGLVGAVRAAGAELEVMLGRGGSAGRADEPVHAITLTRSSSEKRRALGNRITPAGTTYWWIRTSTLACH